ncbi:MAG: endo-1,4-beta-xylanase, partial [Solirubrobacterales bacterium]
SAKNFFYTTLGEQYIDVAFRAAREADPMAKLALNETIWNPRIGDLKADAFLELVRRLKAREVPVDTVGLQTHGMFGLEPPFFPGSTESFRQYLDALGSLGVKVEITELDIALPFLKTEPDPLAAQADLYEMVTLACTRSRHCTGITTWNIRDDDTWLDRFQFTASRAPNEPLLLDAAGRQKPAYGAVGSALLDRCAQPWAVNRTTGSGACFPHWPYLSPRLAAAPSVRWTVNRRRKTVTATILPRSGVGFALTALSGRKARGGRCLAGSPVVCLIKLGRGTWKLAASARLYGVSGPAVSRTVRIR